MRPSLLHTVPRRLVALAALAILPAAHAGMFDADALKAVTILRQEQDARLIKLEEAAQNQLEAANQLENLKAEVAKLRGQVEVLNFELGQTQKRIQDYYVDLDNRVRKLEAAQAAAQQAAAAAANAGATAPSGQQAAPADPEAETRTFEAGLDLFKGNRFQEAAEAFRAFIAKYPSGKFAAGAHYWGGNAHFQLREWAKAGELYAVVPEKWPADPKAPDAMLQLADAQKQGGDAKAAQATLEALVARYPDSQAAATARQRLGKKKAP